MIRDGGVEQTVEGKQCPIGCSFREHQMQGPPEGSPCTYSLLGC